MCSPAFTSSGSDLNPLASFQTNPTYLAKLIFQMPQNKSTKFMDSVIFTLYNYASNQREEYLLLRLFKTALQEEIKYGGPSPLHTAPPPARGSGLDSRAVCLVCFMLSAKAAICVNYSRERSTY